MNVIQCIENCMKMKLISLIIIFSLFSCFRTMGIVLNTIEMLQQTVGLEQLQNSVLNELSPLYSDIMNSNMNFGQYNESQKLWQTSDICGKHLSLLQEGIKNNHLWALKMLDASAKVESGLFYGNLFLFGNYDECIEIKYSYDDNNIENTIKGQYCTTVVLYKDTRGNLPNGNNRIVRQDDSSRPKNDTNFQIQLLPQSSLGLCVPSGCSVQDLQNISTAMLENNSTSISMIFMEGHCSTEDTEIDVPSRSFICLIVFAIVGLLLIVGTLADIFNLPGNILKCFSIYTNGKKLFTVRPNEDNLKCLNGLRVLSMVLIVLGHRLIAASSIPAVNKIFMKFWVNYWYNYFFIGLGFVVDTFFTVSGLLVVFLYMRLTDKGNDVSWIIFLLHRFLRLTPSLAMVVLFYATMMQFFEPVWYPVLDGVFGESCRKYWWTTLLYIQNYWNPNEICAVQTWYLAIDTQLYILAPVLLIMIKKFPRSCILTMILLASLSMAAAFEVTWVNHLGATYLKQGVDEYKYLYTPTHMRIAPWLFGAITGYFIATHKTLPINKIIVYLLWILSLGSLVFVILIQKFYHDHEYNVLQSSFFNAFSRPIWGAAICLIILLCVFNHGGIINWLLSATPFTVLIRINYSIYLIHPFVTSLILSKIKTSTYLSVFSIVHETLGDYCIIVLLATFWTLAFESPIIALEKFLFSKGKYGRSSLNKKNNISNGSNETVIMR